MFYLNSFLRGGFWRCLEEGEVELELCHARREIIKASNFSPVCSFPVSSLASQSVSIRDVPPRWYPAGCRGRSRGCGCPALCRDLEGFASFISLGSASAPAREIPYKRGVLGHGPALGRDKGSPTHAGLAGIAGGQGRAALPIRRGHSAAASGTTFPTQRVNGCGCCRATHGQRWGTRPSVRYSGQIAGQSSLPGESRSWQRCCPGIPRGI